MTSYGKAPTFAHYSLRDLVFVWFLRQFSLFRNWASQEPAIIFHHSITGSPCFFADSASHGNAGRPPPLAHPSGPQPSPPHYHRFDSQMGAILIKADEALSGLHIFQNVLNVPEALKLHRLDFQLKFGAQVDRPDPVLSLFFQACLRLCTQKSSCWLFPSVSGGGTGGEVAALLDHFLWLYLFNMLFTPCVLCISLFTVMHRPALPMRMLNSEFQKLGLSGFPM